MIIVWIIINTPLVLVFFGILKYIITPHFKRSHRFHDGSLVLLVLDDGFTHGMIQQTRPGKRGNKKRTGKIHHFEEVNQWFLFSSSQTVKKNTRGVYSIQWIIIPWNPIKTPLNPIKTPWNPHEKWNAPAMDRPPFRPSEKNPTRRPQQRSRCCAKEINAKPSRSLSSVMVHADDLLGRPRGPARWNKNGGFDHGFYRIYPLEMG